MPEQKNPSPGVTVETAAIRIGATIFTLPRPNRHHNIIWWLSALGIRSGAMHDQGFVLSDGRYAGREEAATIALAAGQLEKLHAPPRLFSEDLWDGGADLPSPEAIKAVASPSPVTRELVSSLIFEHIGVKVETTDGVTHLIYDGLDEAADAILARLSPLPAEEWVVVPATEETIRYVARYGGSCRGCADEDGICPGDGLPCENPDKAIRHVLDAVSYGVRHGYLSAIPSPEKGEGNQEHISSISRSGGSPTTSVKSDSPHSAGLARFARAVLRSLWEGCDLDGGEIQDLGLKHGLIRQTTFDPETHADVQGVGVVAGDEWFVEEAWLAEVAQSSEEQPLGAEGTDAQSPPGMNQEGGPE